MPIPRMVRHSLPRLALVAGWLCAVETVVAQQQERTLEERIKRPNMDMKAEGFEKTFTPTSSGVDKTATTKLFGFSHAATTKGDGTFRTRGFAGKDRIETGSFATKKSSFTDRGAAQSDRGFETKAMAVQEDRAANKSAASRNFQSSDKPFISHGKRQDEIDELRRQKELSIDQVREILNKSK